MTGTSALEGVSRETQRRLEIYVDELVRWQKAINLVSPSSIEAVWTRHVADSLQLADIMPASKAWVDIGSGAGLPGLIIAGSDQAPAVMLVESDSRKCAFLRHAAAAMNVVCDIVEGRIEHVVTAAMPVPDVVTARGLAPLSRLLDYASPLLVRGATGLFPKGDNVERELTVARESWIFDAELIHSRTDSAGRIVRINTFGGRRA